jgi:hypothetical protein
VRLGRAQLRQPQASAALPQQGRAQPVGRRVSAEVRSGEHGFGLDELVELGERVDERQQPPYQGGRRAVGHLEIERQPRIGLRLPYAARADEGECP